MMYVCICEYTKHVLQIIRQRSHARNDYICRTSCWLFVHMALFSQIVQYGRERKIPVVPYGRFSKVHDVFVLCLPGPGVLNCCMLTLP